jgi:branched-chain amino acid aminotransferase
MLNPESNRSERVIWIDGELVPWEQATVHVLSHSLQRGSLIFDYMSVHDTPRGPAVFRMPEHVRRLLRSAEIVGLDLRLGEREIGDAIVAAVRANPGAHSVKVSAYIPSIEVDVVPMDDRVQVAIAAYDSIADVVAKKGVPPPFKPELRLFVEKTLRKMRPDVIPPQAKVAANYTGAMIAKWAARRAGYDEVVLLDANGNLAEGPTTNIFLVAPDGTLRTPATGPILEGVTRSTILAIAKHDGRRVVEESIPPSDLASAAEVFMTGTSAEVWPVVSVDGRPVGSGRAGPVALALRERLREVTGGRDAAFDHWLTYVNA